MIEREGMLAKNPPKSKGSFQSNVYSTIYERKIGITLSRFHCTSLL